MAVHGSLPEAHGALPQTHSLPDLRPTWGHPWRLAASVRSVPAERQAIPWWLWWNILSADAPIVALVWAALFAHASGARLPAADAAVLVLAVWVIYVSDRLLDGWMARNRAALQPRHLFCQRHRSPLTGLLTIASATILWLTISRLPAVDVSAGVKLGAIVVVYMAGIHAGNGRIARILPKEIAVGLLFASGATLPFWSRCIRFPWDACLPWAFFALLCSLNCLPIECWENHRHTGVLEATVSSIRSLGRLAHQSHRGGLSSCRSDGMSRARS
jgi:hypothetical protein